MSFVRFVREVLPLIVELLELLHSIGNADSSEQAAGLQAKFLSRFAVIKEAVHGTKNS